VDHRPASDGDGSSDLDRLFGKRLVDPFDQISEGFIFALARLRIAFKRDRVGPDMA
jgi:hypothetical protein